MSSILFDILLIPKGRVGIDVAVGIDVEVGSAFDCAVGVDIVGIDVGIPFGGTIVDTVAAFAITALSVSFFVRFSFTSAITMHLDL